MYQIGSLIAGYFLGILSKVVGDHLSRSLTAPTLAIEFRNADGFVSKTVETIQSNGRVVGQHEARFIRLRVRNDGRRSAKNCRDFVINWEYKKEADQEFKRIDGGDETLQLIWALSDPEKRLEGFDMSPGVGRYLDLISTRQPSTDFRLECLPFPNKFVHALSRVGYHRLTVQVSAEEAEPQVKKVVFQWQGQWDTFSTYADLSD